MNKHGQQLTRRTIELCFAPWCLGLAAELGAAVAAPLTFNTALPVAEDEFVFRGQFATPSP